MKQFSHEDMTQAVKRLSDVLPLTSNFALLDQVSRKIYRVILDEFFQTGKPPQIADLKAISPGANDNVQNLATNKLVVMTADGEIEGGYAFTIHQLTCVQQMIARFKV